MLKPQSVSGARALHFSCAVVFLQVDISVHGARLIARAQSCAALPRQQEPQTGEETTPRWLTLAARGSTGLCCLQRGPVRERTMASTCWRCLLLIGCLAVSAGKFLYFFICLQCCLLLFVSETCISMNWIPVVCFCCGSDPLVLWGCGAFTGFWGEFCWDLWNMSKHWRYITSLKRPINHQNWQMSVFRTSVHTEPCRCIWNPTWFFRGMPWQNHFWFHIEPFTPGFSNEPFP